MRLFSALEAETEHEAFIPYCHADQKLGPGEVASKPQFSGDRE
jgi:hypothetical protein